MLLFVEIVGDDTLGPLYEGAVSEADWGSDLSTRTTLPPPLRGTSLIEGGKNGRFVNRPYDENLS